MALPWTNINAQYANGNTPLILAVQGKTLTLLDPGVFENFLYFGKDYYQLNLVLTFYCFEYLPIMKFFVPIMQIQGFKLTMWKIRPRFDFSLIIVAKISETFVKKTPSSEFNHNRT